VLFLSLGIVGCAVRLIGDYDDTFDGGVSDVQQKTELYFARLQSTPNTPLDQTFYDGANADLSVLKSRAAALPKYDILIQEIANLKSQLAQFHQLDSITTRPVPAGLVAAAQSSIDVTFEGILKLELALKRGNSSPTPPSSHSPRQ
jgi:hypothetical protein